MTNNILVHTTECYCSLFWWFTFFFLFYWPAMFDDCYGFFHEDVHLHQ